MRNVTERGLRRAAARLGSALLLPLRALAAALVTGRSDPRPPGWLDARRGWWLLVPLGNVVVATLLAINAYVHLAEGFGEPDGAIPATLAALVPVSVAPLVLRVRWPLAAWRLAAASAVLIWVALVATRLESAEALNSLVANLAVVTLLCCYTVATRNPWHVSVGIWLVTVGALLVLESVVPITDGVAPGLGGVFTLVALLLGGNVRMRRQAALARTARALSEERARIARELHDVVAHHMSVIAIQSEAAPLRHGRDADALATELADIRTTALQALAETRRVLAVLRTEGGDAELAPQPGLHQVDDIVSNARAAGHAVTLRTTGTPRSAPAGVELSAYRILQESLSNVMRHAPGAAVDVELDYAPDELRLRVANGPGDTPRPKVAERAEGGRTHGLIGMRERAAMLSGTLVAEPRPGGGFEVLAALPLESA